MEYNVQVKREEDTFRRAKRAKRTTIKTELSESAIILSDNAGAMINKALNLSVLLNPPKVAKAESKRAVNACLNCYKMHRKCDGYRPCGYCNKTNKECVENPNKKKRGRSRKDADSVSREETTLSNESPPSASHLCDHKLEREASEEKPSSYSRATFPTMAKWNPESWMKIDYVEVSFARRKMFVLSSGFSNLEGENCEEQIKNGFYQDNLRKCLIGGANNLAVMPSRPHSERNDVSVVFIDKHKFFPFSCEGIIGTSTCLVQTRQFPAIASQKTLKIETAFGVVKSTVSMTSDLLSVKTVDFVGVPSFVYSSNLSIYIDKVGNITYDICFGGAFYLFVDLDRHETQLNFEENRSIFVRIAAELQNYFKKENICFNHPLTSTPCTLETIIFSRKMASKEANPIFFKELCFSYSDLSEVTSGDSLCARLALEYSRGLVTKDTKIRIEGTFLSASLNEVLDNWYQFKSVIIPSVGGPALVTKKTSIQVNPKSIF